MILIEYGGALLRGLGITLWVSCLALILAAVVGALIGIARTSKFMSLRVAATAYTEFFRSLPTLVMLFFVFYGLTAAFNINLSPFVAATIALGLEGSALMSEVVRGGLQSVGKGQKEAALSSGMPVWQVELYVVWPQAIRVMLPPAVGVYVSTLKGSALASSIGFVELMQTGLLVRERVQNDYDGFTVLIAVAVIYTIVNYAISQAGAHIERKSNYAQ